MYRLFARDNGYVHVCGHRGHSIGAPENTLAALTATRDNGGTCAEIDCMLTSDAEIVLMHDDFLDRTTNGAGLVSCADLATIGKLDAGSWFDPRFAGERVPTLGEAISHAQAIGIGLVIEIKEFQDVERLGSRLREVFDQTAARTDAIVISFDHMVLQALKEKVPGVRTEGITHARHADIVAVARSAGLDSVSIEHMMFHPEVGEALHDAGVAIRLHLQRPDEYARYLENGLNLLADVREWVAAGLVDTISGDDVSFLAAIAAEYRPRARLSA
jgi:glycerophosphoryl diester phosphodiesterase